MNERTVAFRLFLILVLAFGQTAFDFASANASPPEAAGQDIDRLRAAVEKLANGIDGMAGIAIKHIESGQGFSLNGDRQFPTASVYKVPILVEVFRQVEAGTFSLQDRITLRPDMLHHSRILARFDPGLNPTLRDLAFWMITESENGATDILLAKVGAENVTATMRRLGLKQINVNRPVKLMMCDYLGVYDDASRNLTGRAYQEMIQQKFGWYRELWRSKDAPIPESVQRFNREPKDVASPNDIATLLEMIFKGQVVSEQASRQMIEIMLETTFAPDLIPALLPPGTRVARKAGTLPTSLNEVGIIYLPNGKGHVIVAILTNNLRETRESAAGFIAQVARTTYDYFVEGGAESRSEK